MPQSNFGRFPRDLQYAKFSAYGFLKNLRFFEPFLVLFFLDKGVSYLGIGTLYAVREIAINFLEIPTGAVADALGRRRTMISSFVSYLVSFVIFWLGQSFGLFVVAMLFFAFGEAFRTGTHKAMIFTHLKAQGIERFKTDYYGHTRGWSQTGSAVSSLLAAAIVFVTQDYERIFAFATIPYVLDLLLMMTYPKSLDGRRTSLEPGSIGAAFAQVWRGTVHTARTPGAVRTVLSAGAFGGYYKGAKDYLQPLIAALALSVPVATSLSSARREALFIGAVYSVLYVLTATASRKASRIARAFGTDQRAMNWLLLIGIGTGAVVGVTRQIGWTSLAVGLFVVIYVIQNVRKPIGVSVVSDRVPEGILATVLSVESQVQSLSAAVVAFGIGAIAEILGGSVGWGIVGVSLVALLVVPFLWLSRASAETAAGPNKNQEDVP